MLYFCLVCLPKLLVSLDFPFLIAASVFSNVFLAHECYGVRLRVINLCYSEYKISHSLSI